MPVAGGYLRLGGRFHLGGLRRHHTILGGWVGGSICGCLDCFCFLDGGFGAGWIGAGIEGDLTGDGVELAIGSNSEAVRWPASSVTACRRQVCFFVSPHVAVNGGELGERGALSGAERLRSCLPPGSGRRGTGRIWREGDAS